MNSKRRFVATGLLLMCGMLLVCLPASPAMSGSVIGKIAGVTNDSFALQVGGAQERPLMYFLMSPATHIDGELSIGRNAGVEYMSLGSVNIATHVMTDSSATIHR